MRCEVVAVGTELLLGQIVDTNSSWIGEQLAAAGIDSHFQTKVGDNWQRIADSLRLALSRSDAVIVCGGLGPTQDDITRDVIADVMGVELVRDGVIEERIRQMFAARGRAMPENNLRQAMVPEGAQTMAEQPGTAPGLVCPIRWTEPTGEVVDKVIYAVPGVPLEMRQMVTGTVLADLRRRSGTDSVISSRVVRTWGHSESGVAELLAGEIERLHLSARRLIWLNPLLRWDGFAPRARGIRAMLPHVDSMRAGHSIASLEDLAQAISRPEDFGERARLAAMLTG